MGKEAPKTAWGEAVTEASQEVITLGTASIEADKQLSEIYTVPIRLRQTPTTYRVAAHILFTAAIRAIAESW